MQTHTELSPAALGTDPCARDVNGAATVNAAVGAPISWSSSPEVPDEPPVSDGPTAAAPTIYVVDDAPYLTLLYTALLEEAGYSVRAFNDRAEALAALKTDQRKPELLVTDYRGLSLPVEQFLQQCIALHPSLRILMASGFSETEVRVSRTRLDRFLQKPFTPAEFCQQVRAALAPAS